MNSCHLPLEIPKRHSLAAQAADSIRNAITDGNWREYLPSERRLCEMLRVSRPTIRTALRMLSEDGLLEIHQGRRNRLLTQIQPGPRRQSRLIGIVTHEPFSHMSIVTYQIISEMRADLAEYGFTTEVLVCQAHSSQAQRRRLEDFVGHSRLLCCVLISVSKDIQMWFSTRSFPAQVLGSCHNEVKLPSLDMDYRSICRHAGGIFLSKGHRQMALVVPHSGVAGDLASETGFVESIQLNHHSEAHASIVRHNGTAQNISLKLDALFNSAHAPTALLVAKPQHVFIVILYLLKRGLTVPGTVSFIARDHDHIFETVSPPIAHYTLQDDTFAHRLSRLMLQMVSHGNLESAPSVIFPKYFPGGTVRQLG